MDHIDDNANDPFVLTPGRNGSQPKDACCKKNVLFCMCVPEKKPKQLFKDKLRADADAKAAKLPKRLEDEREPAEKFMSLRPSKRPTGDITGLGRQGHPFVVALQLRSIGKSAEAAKLRHEFEQLAISGRTSELEERIPAAVAQFSDLLCPFETTDLKFKVKEYHPELALEYGMTVEDGLVQYYSIGDYEGCDLVTGIAAYLEADLQTQFYEELVKAKELGRPTDISTVWRIQTKNKGGEVCEDHVYRYEVVDALDERAESVLLLVWTLAEDSTQLRGGARIPKPAPGFSRSKFECNMYRFIPFRSKGGKYAGFRLVRFGIGRPAKPLYDMVEMLDDESLRQSACERNEKFVGLFRNHLSTSKDLAKRLKASPRRAFYERVREKTSVILPHGFSRLPQTGRPEAGLRPKDGQAPKRDWFLRCLGCLCCN